MLYMTSLVLIIMPFTQVNEWHNMLCGHNIGGK